MSTSRLSPSPPPAASNETTYSAPALEKGLDILELLANEADGLTQGAIAQRLERSTAEIFRMLSVLERRGYLNRHPDGSYRLSLRLFELAHRHPPLQRLLNVALPAMQELAQQTRQSAHLVIHYAQRILVVAQVDSPEPMGFGVRLGANFPFRPDRASSRVLSAFQPAAVQEALIAELIDNSPVRLSASKVRADLADILRKGFHMASSDTTTGVTDLCAPIFDHSDGAVAALTVPYLKQRDVQVTFAAARTALLATTRRISAGLGAPEGRR
ncbi:MAG: IclR family transcriptional regulator [Gammaproteobacteria bacterium]|nr:IclR family transcriptional regulator [Gammaproteobacteria bacterium]MBU1440734.1 IclR family transcriptional regulator [Gammaproteobacteria bacterium]MBU2287964.1 IclR family transcriptional regulator [Gammaproteobacteria bacterium]MBU2409835.1 IclR family transcriptional regulator [Gammaproteobacteria bacterium]